MYTCGLLPHLKDTQVVCRIVHHWCRKNMHSIWLLNVIGVMPGSFSWYFVASLAPPMITLPQFSILILYVSDIKLRSASSATRTSLGEFNSSKGIFWACLPGNRNGYEFSDHLSQRRNVISLLSGEWWPPNCSHNVLNVIIFGILNVVTSDIKLAKREHVPPPNKNTMIAEKFRSQFHRNCLKTLVNHK